MATTALKDIIAKEGVVFADEVYEKLAKAVASASIKAEPTKTDVLEAVAKSDSQNGVLTTTIASDLGCDHQAVVGISKSLDTIPNLIVSQEITQVTFDPTPEGIDQAKNGSIEARIFKLVPADGIMMTDFEALPEVKALGVLGTKGRSQCLKNKWIKLQKNPDKTNLILPLVKEIDDRVSSCLKYAVDHPGAFDETALKGGVGGYTEAEIKDITKRKLLKKVKVVLYRLCKGSEFTTNPKLPQSDITPEMLRDGRWREMKFKSFNLDAVPKVSAGALHPLLKVRSEFRKIFLDMGFSEMPTNNYVESSFWNFDALFQPQQHPARDAHDTFFMKQPKMASGVSDEAYLERVKEMHERGGHGSIGYRYDWSREEAMTNILRTHTTAVSTRMLYALAQEKPFRPVKYFSIDRVFRNESLDATHLAEFHQVEGVVADYNLTLGHLIGVLNTFFQKLGMKDLKFKPAYNPYTEPSMEIFAYHPDLKKEVEIGNSGIFRPEMLRPMGLPEDVTVIAWGLSVERPTMIKYGYNNIRNLFGAGVDLDLVADNPICRL